MDKVAHVTHAIQASTVRLVVWILVASLAHSDMSCSRTPTHACQLANVLMDTDRILRMHEDVCDVNTVRLSVYRVWVVPTHVPSKHHTEHLTVSVLRSVH